jgi:hypothetical protein
MNWIKFKVTQVKVPFCWKETYGRVSEGKPTACLDLDTVGSICYSKCAAGNASQFASDCRSVCPSGVAKQDYFCPPTEYGRGTGYRCRTTECVGAAMDEMIERCESAHGRNNCEVDFIVRPSVAYPKCKPGYRLAGCCTCRVQDTYCWSFLVDRVDDYSCAKISPGTLIPMSCSPPLEGVAGLCYLPCRETHYGFGQLCVAKCPVGTMDCGAACTGTTGKCVSSNLNQTLASIVLSANIATLGLATPVTGALNVTIKAVDGKTQVVGGTSRVGKAFVAAVNSLQKVSPNKVRVSVLTRLHNPKNWDEIVSEVYSDSEFAMDSFDAMAALKNAFSEDFETQTTATVSSEINQRFDARTAKYLKEVWMSIQLKEMADAYDWKIFGIEFSTVTMVNITGIAGVVAAYVKPICSNDMRFPLLVG